MFKRFIIGSAALLAAGSLILGGDTWSYFKTSVSSVRHAIKKEVPLEFEIQRARTMVAQLDLEVRKCLHEIAEEEVNIEELQKDLDAQVSLHDTQKEQILSQRKDLDLKKETYVYGGKIYTVSEVQRDLADRFGRYQSVAETINRRRQIVASRKSVLSVERKKLDSMLDAKERLLVDIENLDLRLKTLEAADVASSVDVNDSAVARTRQLINEIGKKVAIKQKLVDGMSQHSNLIPIETQSNSAPELTAQIDSYFGSSGSASVVVKSDGSLKVEPVSQGASK